MTLHDTRLNPTLPADHAFVVQLRKGTGLTANTVEGQVEHIVSGQSGEFYSFAELAAFMGQIQTSSHEDAP